MKYDPLKYYLAKLDSSRWNASFTDIEKILGFRLPASARQHQAWWANQEYGTQTSAWKSVGWLTADLNLGSEKISFVRGHGKGSQAFKAPIAVRPAQAVPAEKSQQLPEHLAASIKMIWESLGDLYLDEKGKITFPSIPGMSGLYRFKIREKGKAERRYVGESVNVRGRFTNYRHGNEGQKTSHRIHKLLTEALRNGAEIAVSVVMENAWITQEGKTVQVDLKDQKIRRLFENFAQCIENDTAIESLNL